MRQSTLIFGALIFAFVIYITMRGQLPAYVDLFRKSSGASAPVTPPAAASVTGGVIGGVGTFIGETAWNAWNRGRNN